MVLLVHNRRQASGNCKRILAMYHKSYSDQCTPLPTSLRVRGNWAGLNAEVEATGV
jgi:hypothetical protein